MSKNSVIEADVAPADASLVLMSFAIGCGVSLATTGRVRRR